MATMKNKVIWQEGLFALPQHFQQQQRHCEYLLNRRLDALGDFFWGFTELSINTELLAQGKIMIDRAAGCMPDGTVFSIPDQDLLPEPFQPGTLSSKESHNIYLALPVISDVINEIQGLHSAGQGTERYRLTHTRVRDFHTDEGDEQPVGLGQLIPRIVSGADDLSAMVTLPCAVSSIKMLPAHWCWTTPLFPPFRPSVSAGCSGHSPARCRGCLPPAPPTWPGASVRLNRAGSPMWPNL